MGIPYNQTLTASGGTTPYSWSIPAGLLPPGLALDPATGIISGTPTTAGIFSFTVRVTDDAGATEARTLYITIVNPAPTITTSSLPDGEVGIPYNQTLTASGGTTPYSWSIPAGLLPPGLALDPATGIISGTPTTAATSNFTVQVTDNAGSAATRPLSITINPAPTDNQPPILNAIGNKVVNEGQFLTFTISATDPDGDNLTYSASNLPSGASFTPASRTFAWTPDYSQAGTYPDVHFEVSDGSLTTSENITIIVNAVVLNTGGGGGGGGGGRAPTNAAPVLGPIGNKTVSEEQLLSFSVSATDPNKDTLTCSASNLPHGATFNATTSTFSWTPSYGQAGIYPDIHFEVSDGKLSASENITVKVERAKRPPPEITETTTSDITAVSVTIRWITDKPGTSQVEYWASPSKLSPLNEIMGTEHIVLLTDLTPGTTYHYKTMSRDGEGNLAVSPEYVFSTMNLILDPLLFNITMIVIKLYQGPNSL